jgi:hypothetical protein
MLVEIESVFEPELDTVVDSEFRIEEVDTDSEDSCP